MKQYGKIIVNMSLAGAKDGILNNYGKPVVQLQQEVTSVTDYAPRGLSSRNSGLAGLEAKSAGAHYENKSIRTCLFPIADGVTAEQVQAALDAAPNARLYQVLSTDVVTTTQQDYQIGKGILSKDTLAASQIVRPGGKDPLITEGAFTFRACFLSEDGSQEDQDERELSSPFVPAAFAHFLEPAPSVALAGTVEQERARTATVVEEAEIA